MQLTRFTDFGLRVLMYLTQCRDREKPVTIPEIAERFEISRHHLVKVVHFMSQQGWVAATRGKGGGLALARAASDYRLGELVRTLEHQGGLVDCADPPCALQGACRLTGVLQEALRSFYAFLDGHTLAELVGSPTGAAIIRLHRPMRETKPETKP
ncbi:BadM/Rrf2 family transcriptional regulator [Bordetella trematum]|uniref:DNA-binding protein n=1 Tax=Bordetella trematum TaxID=123899 RepID=A0A157STG1_9BORD|nr:Rrf2 family transcriptional regulator [Bordetella trematum]AUL47479.1 BadM/Rrf2 family transcriptional regulator [Bordetella trematum]AZR94341.1 BadM/Rrf2 family transcriptional regulator [Bordetella trematum]NNH19876.1 Rrf2 family transcriptional regulator [Bordetella trematum]QIM72884.1 Rrf2 family transcriptional regulator [Bordetella trematum]SAI51828.1 DNA-binding protein [Bordetella trematum]